MLYNTPKPQDTKEGLSDQDFSIYMDAHTVPFSKYPSYLPEGVLGMCTEGNAEIQIGLRKYVICANDILIFMPGFLVSFIKSSLTFTIDYCTFSNALFYDVINGSIKRFPTGFHTYTQTHCIYSLSQEKAEQFSPLFPVTIQQSYFSNLFIYKRIYYQSAEITFSGTLCRLLQHSKRNIKSPPCIKKKSDTFFWICC